MTAWEYVGTCKWFEIWKRKDWIVIKLNIKLLLDEERSHLTLRTRRSNSRRSLVTFIYLCEVLSVFLLHRWDSCSIETKAKLGVHSRNFTVKVRIYVETFLLVARTIFRCMWLSSRGHTYLNFQMLPFTLIRRESSSCVPSPEFIVSQSQSCWNTAERSTRAIGMQ